MVSPLEHARARRFGSPPLGCRASFSVFHSESSVSHREIQKWRNGEMEEWRNGRMEGWPDVLVRLPLLGNWLMPFRLRWMHHAHRRGTGCAAGSSSPVSPP